MSPTKKTQGEDSPPPPTGPAPSPTTGSKFFGWMRSLGIQREFGWIGGVAAGIAVRIGVDVVIVRGILVVLAILGSPLLLVYAAAWLLLPDASGRILLEQAIKGTVEPAIAGIAVIALLGALPLAPGYWIGGLWGDSILPNDSGLVFVRVVWTLVIVASIVFFVIWLARSASLTNRTGTPPAPPPPPIGAPESDFLEWRSQQMAWRAQNDALRLEEATAHAADWRVQRGLGAAAQSQRARTWAERKRAARPNPLFSVLVIGLSLVAGGIAALIAGGRNFDMTAIVVGLGVALAVLALGIVVNGARGKRAGAASGVAVLILIPLTVLALLPLPNVALVGGAQFEPHDVSGDLPQFYFAGAGDIVIDLRDYYDEWVVTRDQSDEIYVYVASGNVDVLMPFYDARVTLELGIGDATFVANDGSTQSIETGEYLRDYYPYQSEIQLHIAVGSGDVTINQERFES